MLPLSLVLVLTSALAADLSPEELIARLGSPDRVVREEAARTLEERGAEALPALRAALEAARRAGGPRTVRRPDRPGRGPLARSADDGRARRRRPTARRGRRGARHPQRLRAVTRRPGPRRPTSHGTGPGPSAVLGSGRPARPRRARPPRPRAPPRRPSATIAGPSTIRLVAGRPSGSHRVFRAPSHPSLRHAPASRRELRGRRCLPRSAAERHGDRRGPGVRRARPVHQSQRPAPPGGRR